MTNTNEETIDLTGEAHDRLLSHQREDEELAETLERLLLVLPMYPDVDLEDEATFALVREQTEDGLYRTDEYPGGYEVYREFKEVVEQDWRPEP